MERLALFLRSLALLALILLVSLGPVPGAGAAPPESGASVVTVHRAA